MSPHNKIRCKWIMVYNKKNSTNYGDSIDFDEEEGDKNEYILNLGETNF